MQFLQTLLQQVAYSFENARLYTNLQKSKQDLEVAMEAQKQAQDQILASTRMAALNAGDGGAKKRRPLIAIRTGEESGKVYVSFADACPGIKDEDRPRIFEPFFFTQEKVSQVGLGLWVSDRIVEAHGGEIRFESEEGKGTRFIIRLPAKMIEGHG